MRFLLVTWDGAGNLPPTLALIAALAARGHQVFALGHETQKAALEAFGAAFLSFDATPGWDHGAPRPEGFDPVKALRDISAGSATDTLAAAERLSPDAVLIDCMLPDALTALGEAGHRPVALVHGAYSAHAGWRGPIDGADLALGFSYADFDRGADFPANLVFVGPLRPVTETAPWPRRFPNRPLVVASISTGLQGAAGAQAGLLRRICDALAALEIEAIVTTGRGVAPESLTVAPHTSAVRGVAHERVLPVASLFITHCGHGSIMAAARAACPMLLMPPAADQPHNAALAAAHGLGEVLEPATATAETIRETVTRLLADPALKARCEAFAAEVATPPEPERAVELIEWVAGLG